jgi:hypothetical protein
MRLGLMNTRRTEPPNRMVTLLQGARRRSRMSVEDKLLDRGQGLGSNNTVQLRGRGVLSPSVLPPP